MRGGDPVLYLSREEAELLAAGTAENVVDESGSTIGGACGLFHDLDEGGCASRELLPAPLGGFRPMRISE